VLYINIAQWLKTFTLRASGCANQTEATRVIGMKISNSYKENRGIIFFFHKSIMQNSVVSDINFRCTKE